MAEIPIGGGALNDKYQAVEDVFRQNFADGWEPQGAAFAAYVNGELVVDMWGGYADYSCGWKWREDTMTTFFSCTKSLTAMCFASLVAGGHLDYADLVSKYWPEYAQLGKESTTIANVLHHQAGIPYFTNLDGSVTILDIDDIKDIKRMEQLIEKQKPHHKPGSQSVYHSLTFSWLANGIFRRADPKKRTVGEYFDQEIARKHKLDLFIGKTQDKEGRIARISRYTEAPRTTMKEIYYQPEIFNISLHRLVPWAVTNRSMRNFSAIANDYHIHNNPEMRKVEMPSVNAVGTARSLAKALDLLTCGEIVSKEFFENNLSAPVLLNEYDGATGAQMSKGHGFLYTKSPRGDWMIGHSGVGGQNVKSDPKRKITFAYLTNGLKAGSADKTRTMKQLEFALYECVRKMEK